MRAAVLAARCWDVVAGRGRDDDGVGDDVGDDVGGVVVVAAGGARAARPSSISWRLPPPSWGTFGTFMERTRPPAAVPDGTFARPPSAQLGWPGDAVDRGGLGRAQAPSVMTRLRPRFLAR